MSNSTVSSAVMKPILHPYKCIYPYCIHRTRWDTIYYRATVGSPRSARDWRAFGATVTPVWLPKPGLKHSQLPSFGEKCELAPPRSRYIKRRSLRLKSNVFSCDLIFMLDMDKVKPLSRLSKRPSLEHGRLRRGQDLSGEGDTITVEVWQDRGGTLIRPLGHTEGQLG